MELENLTLDKNIEYIKIDNFPDSGRTIWYIQEETKHVDKFFANEKNQFTFKDEQLLSFQGAYNTLGAINKHINIKENQDKYEIDLERYNNKNYLYYRENFYVFQLYNKYKDKEIKIVYLNN